ncbi:hypothetical protein [Prochlorococcus marinus]|nr:hypothetical protein [Prochlorococcus marinus]
MSQIEQIIPLLIGGFLAWFVFLGIRELLSEASTAFNKQQHV